MAPGALLPAGILAWKLTLPDPAVSSKYNTGPLVARDGTIYVTLGEKLLAIDHNGVSIKWTFTPSSNLADISSSPVILENGDLIVLWFNGLLRRISPTGQEVWVTTIGVGNYQTHVAVTDNGHILCAQGTSFWWIRAYDVNDGSFLWQNSGTTGNGGMALDPTGRLYSSWLRELNPATGAPLWTYGNTHGTQFPGHGPVITSSGYVVTVNADGASSELRRYDLDGNNLATLALADPGCGTKVGYDPTRDLMLIPQGSGDMKAIRVSTMSLEWTWNGYSGQTGLDAQEVYSGPIIVGDVAYLVDSGVSLWAVNMADGSTRWQYTNSLVSTRSPLAISSTGLLLLQNRAELLAFILHETLSASPLSIRVQDTNVTAITITGGHFSTKAAIINCHYGTTLVKIGTVINHSTVTCPIPLFTEINQFSFSFYIQDIKYSYGTSRPATPFTFTYIWQPEVTSLITDAADPGVLIIKGDMFSTKTLCRLGGSEIVEAVYRDATEISCFYPSTLVSLPATLEVALNRTGVPWVHAGMVTAAMINATAVNETLFLHPYSGKNGDLQNTGRVNERSPLSYPGQSFTPNTQLWTTTTLGSTTEESASAPLISNDGFVYLTTRSGSNYRLEKRSLADGSLDWNYSAVASGNAALSRDGAHIYVMMANNRLHCLRTADGVKVWETPAETYSSEAVKVGLLEDRVYFMASYILICLSKDGVELWRHTPTNPGGAFSTGTVPAFSQNGTVVYVFMDTDYKAFNALTGALLWSVPQSGCCGGDVVVSPLDGSLVLTGDTVKYVSPSGVLKWEYSTGGDKFRSYPAVTSDGNIIVTSSTSKAMYAFTPTGAQLWKTVVPSTVQFLFTSQPTIYEKAGIIISMAFTDMNIMDLNTGNVLKKVEYESVGTNAGNPKQSPKHSASVTAEGVILYSWQNELSAYYFERNWSGGSMALVFLRPPPREHDNSKKLSQQPMLLAYDPDGPYNANAVSLDLFGSISDSTGDIDAYGATASGTSSVAAFTDLGFIARHNQQYTLRIMVNIGVGIPPKYPVKIKSCSAVKLGSYPNPADKGKTCNCYDGFIDVFSVQPTIGCTRAPVELVFSTQPTAVHSNLFGPLVKQPQLFLNATDGSVFKPAVLYSPAAMGPRGQVVATMTNSSLLFQGVQLTGQTTVDIPDSGEVKFLDLGINSPRGLTIPLLFTTTLPHPNGTSITFTIPWSVRTPTCAESIPNSEPLTPVTCQCSAGYWDSAGTCTPCAPGSFKTTPGNGPCTIDPNYYVTINVPEPPAAPLAPLIGGTSVNLTWVAPNPNAFPITKYDVLWDAGVTGSSSATVVLATRAPSQGLFLHVTSLQSQTTYRFAVKAFNQAGVGGASPDTSVTTLARGTISGFGSLAPVVSQVTATSAQVTWSPASDDGGVVVTYEILWGPSATVTTSNPAGVVVVATGTATSQGVVQNLAPSTAYKVYVRARNNVGTALITPASALFTTLSPSGPLAPSPPTFTRIASRSALMSWTAPVSDGGSAITEYRLYHVITTSPFFERKASVFAPFSSTLQFYFYGLDAATTYSYQVSAVTATAESSKSGSGTFTTLSPGAPIAPPTPAVDTVTTDSVVLALVLTQDDGASPITSYEVYPLGASTAVASLPIPATTPRLLVTIAGLNASTVYRFTVTAKNDLGESPHSSSCQATTKSGTSITQVTPSFGPRSGGTVVTVAGIGLASSAQDLSQVNIGTAACSSPRWLSSTSVSCVSPPSSSAGPNLVTVKLASGLSLDGDYPNGLFSYNREGFDHPPPTVRGLSPSSGPQAGGTVVTIIGESLAIHPRDVGLVLVAGIECQSVRYVSSKLLECTTREATSGASGPAAVSTQSGGQNIATHLATIPAGMFAAFTYLVNAPTITHVIPRLVPTTGGVVTIVGTSFGTSSSPGMIVQIDGVLCSNPSWLSETRISCYRAGPSGAAPTLGITRAVPVKVTLSSGHVAESTYALGYGLECAVSGCNGVNSLCSGTECTCVLGWQPPPACNERLVVVEPIVTPGSNSTTASGTVYTTNEDGQTFSIRMRLQAAPTSSVFVSATTNDPSEGVVSPLQHTFTVASWSIPLTVTVNPVFDGERDGDVPYTVQVQASSRDLRFLLADPVVFKMRNLDAQPVVSQVRPTVVPLAGGILTVTASNVDAEVFIYIIPQGRNGTANAAPILLTQVSAEEANATWAVLPNHPMSSMAHRHLLQVGRSGAKEGIPLYVKVPKTSSDTYYSLIIQNSRSGQRTYNSAFFQTDDCPNEGSFGRGGECRDCPEGALCPGGYRLRPLPGYWAPDENSGVLVKCQYPERCPGWTDDLSSSLSSDGTSYSSSSSSSSSAASRCALGFAGYGCSECGDGYYPVGETCLQCPSQAGLIAYILCDALLWALVALSCWFLQSDSDFQKVIASVVFLQMMGGAGTMATKSLPSAALQVYDIMHMFMGDFETFKPGCSSSATYEVRFGSNLVYNIAIGIFMVIGTKVLGTIWKKRAEFYHNRFYRALTAWLSYTYFNTTRKALEALMCTSISQTDSQTLYLVAAPEVQCFTGMHVPVAAISVVMLIFITFGWPVWYTYYVHHHPNQVADEEFRSRWGHEYEVFKTSYRYWFLLKFAKMLLFAVCESILFEFPTLRFVVMASLFFVSMCLVFRLAPYASSSDDYLEVMLDLWEVAALTTLFISRFDVVAGSTIDALALTVAVLMLLLILVIYGDLLYHLVLQYTVRRLRKGHGKASAADYLADQDEEDTIMMEQLGLIIDSSSTGKDAGEVYQPDLAGVLVYRQCVPTGSHHAALGSSTGASLAGLWRLVDITVECDTLPPFTRGDHVSHGLYNEHKRILALYRADDAPSLHSAEASNKVGDTASPRRSEVSDYVTFTLGLALSTSSVVGAARQPPALSRAPLNTKQQSTMSSEPLTPAQAVLDLTAADGDDDDMYYSDSYYD